MKKILTPIALSVLVLSLTPIHAATTHHKHVKKHHVKKQATPCAVKRSVIPPTAAKRFTQVGETTPIGPAVTPVAERVQSNDLVGPTDLPSRGLDYFPIDLDVPGQSFVSTGPYIGVPLEYSGSNLIINNPSVNQDVALLKVRKNINKRMCQLGLNPESQRSHLLLSGVVEAEAGYRKPEKGKSSSDIDLTSVGLDGYILGPSTWTSALFALNYDNLSGATDGALRTDARNENSRVFVNKAFIVLGDFSRSPFYASFGQMFVPFGVYSTSMISSPLTKLLARIKARAITLGFDEQCPNGWFGSLFVFRGDSYTGSGNHINNGGANLGYHFELGKDCFSGKVGGSFIANLADSQGLQYTGNGSYIFSGGVIVPTSFDGFGGLKGTGSEKLAHRVPAFSAYTSLSIGKGIDVIGEYISATRTFSPADLTMNSHGARPQALNAEIAYTFQGIEKPTSLSLGYGMTKDALAIGLPARRVAATLNTSLWKSTLQSLELRHDINYASSDYSSGSGIPGPNGKGGSDNAVLLQFDIYF